MKSITLHVVIFFFLFVMVIPGWTSDAPHLEDGSHKGFYEDGALEAVYSIKNGQLEGLATLFRKDGTKKNEILYKNGKVMLTRDFDKNEVLTKEKVTDGGKPQGVIKLYSKDGYLSSECYFKKTVYDGPCKTFYPNGKLHVLWNYKDGKYNGEYRKYYSNDTLQEERSYGMGKQVGRGKSYYLNGQLYGEFLSDKNGTFQWAKYYDNHGNPDASVTFDKNDKRLKIIRYGESGKVTADGYLNITNEQTEYTLYYPTGVVWEKCKSLDKLNVGCIGYDETDKLLNGELKIRSNSGKLIIEGKYINGKRDGKFTTYYPSGAINGSAEYLNGERITSKVYFETGPLQFEKRNKADKGTLYDEEGNVLVASDYKIQLSNYFV